MAGMGIGMAMGQQMAGTFGHGSTAQGTAGQRFCPNCGAKVGTSRFCPECGTKLS
jgi:predicted amidophosphoribosyltransferase